MYREPDLTFCHNSNGAQERTNQKPLTRVVTSAPSDISCASTAVEDDFESLARSKSSGSGLGNEADEGDNNDSSGIRQTSVE